MLTWIIPVYNGEKYLPQVVTSILNQPCTDSRIIIVDDGSTDATLSIAKTYEGTRVKVIHKENGGVSSARNCGIRAADTTYIAFLDADDVLCKDIFDSTLASLLATEKYELISLAHYVADQQLTYGKYIPVRNEEGTDCVSAIDHFKHCSSFIYHRSLFDGEDSIRFPEGIRIREDVTFQFLINHKARNFISINRGLFVHRNNILSVMHNISDTRFIIQDVIPAWEWCKEHCLSDSDRKQCNILIFAEAVSYIQLSCMDGVPLSEIQTNLSVPAIQESLVDYEQLWKSRRMEYESFLSEPVRYWQKHRIRGLISHFLKRIVRLPFIRPFYLRMQYKESIGDFIYH